jgi:hypothetical protein
VILSLVLVVSGCQKTGTNPANLNSNTSSNSTENNQISSEDNPALQGNVPLNSIVAEKDSHRYFLSHDGDRAGYLVDTSLYRQGINESSAVRLAIGQIEYLQTAGDYVYYLKQGEANVYHLMQLCRINTKTANPKEEIVKEDVNLYSLYDHWAFYWDKKDSSLYRLDLATHGAKPQKIAEFADLDSLIARGDFILVIERETVRKPQKIITTSKIWKLSADGSKKDLLMSEDYYKVSFIQPYQDSVYFVKDYSIQRINITGGNSEKVYTPDATKIQSFKINNNRIYAEEYSSSEKHIYTSMNLDGTDKRLIFTYHSPVDTQGSTVNGALDKMNIHAFDITQDYLVLTGSSYYIGEILTTRIPIAGEAGAKKEEVFFNGAWISIKDYFEEADRVLTSKGLK